MAKSMIAVALVLLVACGSPAPNQAPQQPAVAAALPTGTLDQLLAPIALYPDQLLAQILMSASNPSKVTELAKWLKSNANLKGTELQDAAVKAGFDASFVALALFPQVVSRMAEQIAWTRVLGQAFTSDRTAVFASIQKLRKQAQNVGTLKSTPQQEVETKKTSSGEQVIIIEPTNPQIVYVPQYNTEVVYTQPPSSTTVIIQEDDNDAEMAIAAGLIGFTAGIAIGAAMDNHYYYGPYGWHGGAYMYNDAWDDYYDAREDARDDWMDHREDLVDERSDRLEDRGDNRSDRLENTQEQRTDRQENRQENRPAAQAERAPRTAQTQSGSTPRATTARVKRARFDPARLDPDASSGASAVVLQAQRLVGHSSATRPEASSQRASSDAFSGYSERLISARLQRSGAAKPQQQLAQQRLTWRRAPAMSSIQKGQNDHENMCGVCGARACLIAATMFSSSVSAQAAQQFASPEEAVKALVSAVKAGNVADLAAILGAESKD